MTDIDDVAVIGTGKIELFCERGLRKIDEVPFTNAIIAPGITFLKWFGRYDYTRPWEFYSYTNWQFANYPDYRPAHVFSHLLLTTNSTPVNTAVERLRGAVVGYANKDTYSGTDNKRGNPNYSEMTNTPEFVRWVFDWQTNAGNGTFQSILWCLAREGNPWAPYGRPNLFRNIASLTPYPSNGAYWSAYDPATNESLITSFGNNSVYKAPWGTLAFVPAFSLANMSLVTGTAIIGNELFAEDYHNASKISVYNKTTGAVLRTFPTPPFINENSGHGSLTTDGVNLYKAHAQTNPASALGLIQKWAPDGTLLGSFTIGTQGEYSGSKLIYGLSVDTSVNEILVSTSDAYILLRYGASGADFGVYKGSQAHDQSSLYSGHPDPPASVSDGAGAWFPSAATNVFHRYAAGSDIGAKVVLPTSVTKTNVQTMKITYQFNFA